jgi:hypothetical protein
MFMPPLEHGNASLHKVKRRFVLHHPDGFPDAEWRSFVAQCRVWRATIEATLANWDDLSLGRLAIPKPDYRFGEPELSADGTLAALTVDGELAAAAASALEPNVPAELYHDFPLWFRLDLEVGRALGDDQPTFTPLVDPERAQALKASPLFKK